MESVVFGFFDGLILLGPDDSSNDVGIQHDHVGLQLFKLNDDTP